MRARQRHFNPKSAGANFCWDTRYNADGHVNNGAVGTWTDRANNAATQTATSPTDRRPTWKDNANDNINGSPVLQFDGTDDFLQTASITSATAAFGMGVMYRNWASGTGVYRQFLQTESYGSGSGIAMLTYAGGAAHEWIGASLIANGNGYNPTLVPRASSTSTTGYANATPRIASCELTSSSTDIWVDGISIKRNGTNASVPSTTSTLRIGGNTSTNDWGDYRVGAAIYFKDSAPSAPVRKRLQHAAALSFKIPCS